MTKLGEQTFYVANKPYAVGVEVERRHRTAATLRGGLGDARSEARTSKEPHTERPWMSIS